MTGWILGLGALLLALAGLAALRRVPQGFAYTVERLGRYVRTLHPGPQFLIPLIERVGVRQDMRERSFDIEVREVLTRDRVPLDVDLACFFQVVDAARASYAITGVYDAVSALFGATLRSVIGAVDFDEAFDERRDLNARLLDLTEDSATAWGVRLTHVELRDLRPPASLLDAVGEELRAERKRRAQVLEAAGERRAEVLRAEGRKQSALLEAESRQRSEEIEAEVRERRAEAEARAAVMLSEAVTHGSPHALNYLVARDYVDALKTLAASEQSRVVLFPMESGGLSGSLAGISQLAEAAFASPTESASERSAQQPDPEAHAVEPEVSASAATGSAGGGVPRGPDASVRSR